MTGRFWGPSAARITTTKVVLCLVAWLASAGAAHAARVTTSVPQKDAARIAQVPTAVLGDAELVAHLGRVRAAVEARVPADEVGSIKRMLPALRQGNPEPRSLGRAAAGAWMLGRFDTALLLLGAACTERDPNPDDLNNYAALLTMAEIEEAALPILLKLDRQFPGNSTVLNNIGQAWFGLGDLEKSEKALDGALRAFARHSQANLTKAIILESRGDRPAAIEAVRRSLQEGYAPTKEKLLRRLGQKLEPADLPWRLPRKNDGLGLSRFQPPPYARNTAQLEASRREWDEFAKAIEGRIQGLKARKKTICDQAKQEDESRVRELKAWVATQPGRRLPSHLLPPPLSRKAEKRQRVDNQQASDAQRQLHAREKETDRTTKALRQEYQRQTKEVGAMYSGPGKRTGEEGGGGTPDEVICAKMAAIRDPYLDAVNGLEEQRYKEKLAIHRRRLNGEVYWAQFTSVGDARLECIALDAKLDYLAKLKSGRSQESTPTCGVPDPPYRRGGPLPDFYDMNCPFKSRFNMAYIGSIETSCNKMTTNLGAGPLAIYLKENLDTGKIIRGTVELEVSESLGSSKLGWKGGPLKAELEASAGAFLEFDDGGMTDMGLKAGVKATAGTDTLNLDVKMKEGDDKEVTNLGVKGLEGTDYEFEIPADRTAVTISLEGRIGINSGPSLKGGVDVPGVTD